MFGDPTQSLEERLLATFIEVCNDPECLPAYERQGYPPSPAGFEEAWLKYRELPDDRQAEGWQKILSKYSGFVKRKLEVEEANDANFGFLKEMFLFFEKRGLLTYAYKIKKAMNTYERF